MNNKAVLNKTWSVYLLKCSDNSLYCGVTNNIENRLIKHNNGTASKYTRARRPVELAAIKNNLTKSDAYKIEYCVKKLPADKKITALFTGPHEVKLEEWISCAPFEKLLGIKIIKAQNGRAVLTMPFVFQLAQGRGIAHGGAIVTLADTAVAMAVKSIVPPDSRFGTISLNSEFIAPVTKGVLTAKAKVKLLENKMIRGVSTVFNEDNIKVMKFSSLFKLAKDVEIKIQRLCPKS